MAWCLCEECVFFSNPGFDACSSLNVSHDKLVFVFIAKMACTVKPVLNGISRVQNIFLLKPGFRSIKVYYDSHGT
jgi:hypothetical protein